MVKFIESKKYKLIISMGVYIAALWYLVTIRSEEVMIVTLLVYGVLFGWPFLRNILDLWPREIESPWELFINKLSVFIFIAQLFDLPLVDSLLRLVSSLLILLLCGLNIIPMIIKLCKKLFAKNIESHNKKLRQKQIDNLFESKLSEKEKISIILDVLRDVYKKTEIDEYRTYLTPKLAELNNEIENLFNVIYSFYELKSINNNYSHAVLSLIKIEYNSLLNLSKKLNPDNLSMFSELLEEDEDDKLIVRLKSLSSDISKINEIVKTEEKLNLQSIIDNETKQEKAKIKSMYDFL